MNKQLEKIKSDLNNSLYELSHLDLNIDRLNHSLNLIDSSIAEVNSIAENIQFDNDEEEILYFKHFKPEILSCRMEEVMKYQIYMHLPIGTTEIKIKYLEDELKARQSYFRMNAYHYQYYKSGSSDLDHIYFLAGAGPLSVPVADLSDYGNEFSTPMTYLFAKFMALEHIQYFILEQIAQLTHPEHQTSKEQPQAFNLKWTGDSVNIVELAYGIWLTGQLNNGNASLNQIVRWLEGTLQISVGVIQRRFIEIERRKRLSVTKYIDQMREAILRKIEGGNS